MISNVRDNATMADNPAEQIEDLFILLRRIEGEQIRTEDIQLIGLAIEEFVNSVMGRLYEEEKELVNSHYSGIATHLARHRFLASQANLLKIAFHAGQLTLARSVVAFLRTWLNYHISREEQDYMVLLSSF